jgi:hypothetical protein
VSQSFYSSRFRRRLLLRLVGALVIGPCVKPRDGCSMFFARRLWRLAILDWERDLVVQNHNGRWDSSPLLSEQRLVLLVDVVVVVVKDTQRKTCVHSPSERWRRHLYRTRDIWCTSYWRRRERDPGEGMAVAVA